MSTIIINHQKIYDQKVLPVICSVLPCYANMINSQTNFCISISINLDVEFGQIVTLMTFNVQVYSQSLQFPTAN